jgi:hypothetical protein
MFRFLLGLVAGLLGGYVGVEYLLKRQEEERRQREELIEIDQIPLPST